MELLVLLAACIVIGLSGGEDVKVLYGESHRFYLYSHAEYLYFESDAYYQSTKVPLWTRSKPSNTIRGRYESRYFKIEKLTQTDNGKYTIQSRLRNTLGTYRVNVSPHEKHISKNEDEQLLFDFPLELKSCTVTFTYPDDGETTVISHGEYERQRLFDWRLQFRSTQNNTYLEIVDLKAQDSGVFVIRDDKANLAMRVTLEVAAPVSIGLNIGIAAGAISIVVCCCCGLKRCCCKKSSKSSEEVAEPADDPPELQDMPPLPRYHVEPMPPSASGGPVYSYRPANPAPSSVEMYSPPPVPFIAPSAEMYSPPPVPFTAPSAEMYSPPPVPFTAPSAEMYSSVPSTAPPALAPATGSQAGTQDSSFGSNFLSSETDPCFEMKGMNLGPPLYSECVSVNVYTSDKLNFGFL